jgi:hypothetical protein
MRIDSDCQLRSEVGKTRKQRLFGAIGIFQRALASTVDMLPQAAYRFRVETEALQLILDPFDALL